MGSACRSGDWRQAVDSSLQVSLSLLGRDSFTVCQRFERLLYSCISRKSVEAFVAGCRPMLVLSTSFCACATAQCLLADPGVSLVLLRDSGETALILSLAWPWVPFEVCESDPQLLYPPGF